jgi:DNA-binding transcriptional ArsR family regulator
MPAADPLSATFAALADPTRRAILARLAQGQATVSELAQPFAMSLPGISKHLRVLRSAGLVVQGRDAQWRPCRLDPARLAQVDRWLEDYRALWESRFDQLESYLRETDLRETGGAARAPDGGADRVSETHRPRPRSKGPK